jgi:hypothetical protein
MVLIVRTFAALTFVAASFIPVYAQDQQRKHQPGWPCTGTVSPDYIRSAEATGGAVMLVRPTETAGVVAAEMPASRWHEETVFRAAGTFPEGLHEFDVALDSTIESVISVSIQCLQSDLIQPSGRNSPLMPPAWRTTNRSDPPVDHQTTGGRGLEGQDCGARVLSLIVRRERT